MNRPRLLDLFCGAGGAAVGYHRAGFDVVGVDNRPQPRYPFPFLQADALEVLADPDLRKRYRLGGRVDFVHASPPCQASSALTKGTNRGREYPQLIPATREALASLGLPYLIENVAGAPIRHDLMLCGEMFGLGVIRHRFFELSGLAVMQIPHPPHKGRVAGMRHGEWFTGPYLAVYGEGGGKGTVAQWQQAMGIDWTDVRVEIAEAIPPAYSEWLGAQLLDHLKAGAA